MIQLLGIFQFIIILGVLVYEYKKGSISIFLWAMLLLVVGVAHLIFIFFKSESYSSIVFLESNIFNSGFILLYFITRIFLIKISKKNNIFSLKNVLLKKETKEEIYLEKVMQFLSIFSVLAICIYSDKKYGGILNVSWGNLGEGEVIYSYGKDIYSVIYFWSRMLITIPAGLLFIYFYKKKYLKYLIWLGILGFHVIITRNRADILPLLAATCLVFIVKYRKISLKIIIIGITLGIISILLMYGLRLFRFYGTLDNFLDNFVLDDFIEKLLKMLKDNNGELNLIDAYYYFIENDNNFKDFGQLSTYIRIILFWLPTRFSGGIKPFDFAIMMGSAYSRNIYNTTYSMHPTLFGDCYANLGFLGIVLGIFWAVFVKVIDRLCDRKKYIYKIFLSVIWGYSYIVIGRGSVYNGFYYGIRGTIILGIIYFIVKVMLVLRKGIKYNYKN